VQQWDAKTKSWSLITDYMGSDRAIIDKLIAEDSNKYAAEQKIAARCN
jgi:branched-chain amino acid transport system substrate-binding protein